MNINGIDYLIYYVPKKHDKRYIASAIYDIEKEREYKNFIILTDDVQNVKMNDLVFGKDQVLVLEDNGYNRENLKYLPSVDWARIVENYYDNKVFWLNIIFVITQIMNRDIFPRFIFWIRRKFIGLNIF